MNAGLSNENDKKAQQNLFDSSKLSLWYICINITKTVKRQPKIKTRVDSSTIQLLMYTVVALQHFTAIF